MDKAKEAIFKQNEDIINASKELLEEVQKLSWSNLLISLDDLMANTIYNLETEKVEAIKTSRLELNNLIETANENITAIMTTNMNEIAEQ